MGNPVSQENVLPLPCRPYLAAIAVAAAFFLPLLATALVLRWTLASVSPAGPPRGEAALYRETGPSGHIGFRSIHLADPRTLAFQPTLANRLLALKGTTVSQETSRDVIFYTETPAGLEEAGFLRGDGLYTYSPTLPVLSPEETSGGTVAVSWSYGPWRHLFSLDYALRRIPESALPTPAGTFFRSLPVELDIRIGPDTFQHRLWYAGERSLFPLLHEARGPAGLVRYELLSATWLPPGSVPAVVADEIGCSGLTYLERSGPERSGTFPHFSAPPSLSLYWQASLPNDITSPPLCASDLLLFGDGQGLLWAMDVERGEVRWKFDTGRPILAAPAVSGGIVYVAAGDRLYALEAANGLFLWSTSADDRLTASPLLLGNLLFFGTEGGTFYALEARRGTERWRFEAGDAILSPAAGSRNTVLFGDASGLLYALDAVQGTLRWQIELERLLAPPSIAEGMVYVGLGGGMEGGRMVALSLVDGSIRWSTSLSGDILSAPAVGDEMVYAVTGLGYGVALGREDGRPRWQAHFPEGVPQAPLLVGRTLILADTAGSVHLLDGESGEEWMTRGDLFPLGAPPDFCQGRILLADRYRHVYVLGDPAGRSLRLSPRWDRLAVEESSGAAPVGGPQEWAGQPLLLLDNGDLRLYNPVSGEFVLLAELGGFANLPPLVQGDTAYIALSYPETGEISTTLVAYDLAGRKVRWKRGLDGLLRFPPSAAVSSLLLCLDTLSGGRLLALDLSGGVTLWETSLQTCTGAPLVEDGHVFLAAGHLGAWDLSTGDPVWLSSATFVQGTPIRCGETLYTGLLEEGGFSLAAFDPLSGRMLWKASRNALFLRPACEPSSGRVLVGWSDGLLQAYSGDTGTPRWGHESGDLLLSDLVVEDGVVYGITGEEALMALDAGNGRLLARYTPPYALPGLAPPLVMDGTVFFADRIFLYALEVVHE